MPDTTKRTRPYVGMSGNFAEVFRATTDTPTEGEYRRITGPFRTMRAARWFAFHHPFARGTIADMERAAVREPDHTGVARRDSLGHGRGYGPASWRDTLGEY